MTEPDANVDGSQAYLERILRLRVEVVLISLLSISLVLFILSYLGQMHRWDWVKPLPLVALATTALSTGIIGVIYEWIIRRDAFEQLRGTISQLSRAERPVLAREVASTIVTDDTILHHFIGTNNAERILMAALTAASGNTELADGVRRGVVDGALRADDYWENYRARIFVTDSHDLIESDQSIDSFFNFVVGIRYEMKLRKSVFRFGATTSLDDLKVMMLDRAFDGSWLVAPSKPYESLDESLFSLQQIRVGGISLDLSSRSDPGRLIFAAESSQLGTLVGQRVEVEYRYRFKFDKRGHIFVVNVRVPTRRASYEFDFSDSSIVHMNVFDFLISGSTARVRQGLDASRPRTVEVEASDWVFPGGGVAFSWVLQAEHDANFIERIGHPES